MNPSLPRANLVNGNNGLRAVSAEYSPNLISTAPSESESFRLKLISPAIASEPYWAVFSSRNTSMLRRARLEWQKCLRLRIGYTVTQPGNDGCTVTTTAINHHQRMAGAKPRRLAGLTRVAASLMGWSFTFSEGTRLRSRLLVSPSPCCKKSSPVTTSTGAVESV